jgi:hypothetical protein
MSDSVAEWASLPDGLQIKEKQSKSLKQQQVLFRELDKANAILLKSKAMWDKFEARFQHLAAVSTRTRNVCEACHWSDESEYQRNRNF